MWVTVVILSLCHQGRNVERDTRQDKPGFAIRFVSVAGVMHPRGGLRLLFFTLLESLGPISVQSRILSFLKIVQRVFCNRGFCGFVFGSFVSFFIS